MKIKNLINEINGDTVVNEVTCDTVKAGNPENEVVKVAVAMFPTVEIIREVRDWGANLLIVHEPCFYDHMDKRGNDPVTEAKFRLLDESGIVLYRFHDHPHRQTPDMITAGELEYLGLTGKLTETPYYASYHFTCDTPLTAHELGMRIEERLGIKHVRICGVTDKKFTKYILCFGTPSGVMNLLKSEEVEIVLVGEASEWSLDEYVRDAAALGFSKAMIIMGHIGSERDGMKLLTKRLLASHPEITTRYFECGEVYSYTDDK